MEATHDAPGTLIRARREAHGLSQARLALGAGTTQAAVSRLERGELSPSVATLERLLEAMGEVLELSARPATAE
jgi:transcriptional regulator with XRE-family HTH domain